MFKGLEQINTSSNANQNFALVLQLTEKIDNNADASSVINELIKIYWDLDGVPRYHIIVSFIEHNRTDVLGFLKKVLSEDTSELIRHEAAFGIGQMGDSTQQFALADSLKNDTSAIVRHEAAIALATVGSRQSIGVLQEVISDASEEEVVTESAEYSLRLIIESSK